MGYDSGVCRSFRDEGVCVAEHAGSQISVDLFLTPNFSVFEEPQGIIWGDTEPEEDTV